MPAPQSAPEPQAVSDDLSEEASDATQLILQDIQAGVFPPGAWLKQIDLETRYGKGRNEIRRALDRLLQKRLVAHVPNRGYHVYLADGKQASDIGEIRIILETGIVDLVVARASASDVAALRGLAQAFEDCILTGTMIEIYEANLAFHRAIIILSGNGELESVIADLRQRTSSAPVSQWTTRARIEKSAKEHHEMVDALEERDAAGLKALIARHIRQAPTPG